MSVHLYSFFKKIIKVFENYLCVLDRNPWSDMPYAKIASQFVVCFFILLTAFLKKIFSSDEIWILHFFFYESGFWYHSWEIFASAKVTKILCFALDVV